MPKRLSLSNRFFAISHKQFLSLTNDFQQACTNSFGVKTKLIIDFYDNPKIYSQSKKPETIKRVKNLNAESLYESYDSLFHISRQAWSGVHYIEVAVKPTNKSKAPEGAMAHIEFLGNNLQQASFFIQPNMCQSVLDVMKEKYPRMIVGDSSKPNSNRRFSSQSQKSTANLTSSPAKLAIK